MSIDVSHLQNLGSQGTKYVYERPNSAMLESFASPFKGSPDAVVHIEFPEFTSVCPKTGQPDFANIVIDYCPREQCVESKSLKLYFFAWRSEGVFMEAITNRIAKDLFEAIEPLWITVEGRFNPRGGTTLWPNVTIKHPDFEA